MIPSPKKGLKKLGHIEILKFNNSILTTKCLIQITNKSLNIKNNHRIEHYFDIFKIFINI